MLANSSILFGLSSAQRIANRAVMSKSSKSVRVWIRHTVGKSCLRDYTRNQRQDLGFFAMEKDLYMVLTRAAVFFLYCRCTYSQLRHYAGV